MAKQKTEIRDDAVYNVEPMRQIQVGRGFLNPGGRCTVRGDVLRELLQSDPDAIQSWKLKK